MDELIKSVKLHEGYRSKAYQDSVGVWTIGYGTNLQVLEIDEGLAEQWLIKELEKVAVALILRIPWIVHLTETRQNVLIEMGYNLGIAGLLNFKNMLAACKSGNFAEAKRQGLDSKWARQVGRRANTLMKKLERG